MSPTERRALAEQILGAVGATLWLEREQHMDVVTAVSGSGPAYFFLLIEMLEQAGDRAGAVAGSQPQARHRDRLRLGRDGARGQRVSRRPARAGHVQGRHDRGSAAGARRAATSARPSTQPSRPRHAGRQSSPTSLARNSSASCGLSRRRSRKYASMRAIIFVIGALLQLVLSRSSCCACCCHWRAPTRATSCRKP